MNLYEKIKYRFFRVYNFIWIKWNNYDFEGKILASELDVPSQLIKHTTIFQSANLMDLYDAFHYLIIS